MTLAADPAPRAGTARESTYRPRGPLDLHETVGILRRGPRDPTVVRAGSVLWLALRTEAGVATLALRTGSGEVRASAWGPGAGEALARVPAELAEVRARLQAGLPASPLFAVDLYARHIESAYETMAARMRAGVAPEAFAVAAL